MYNSFQKPIDFLFYFWGLQASLVFGYSEGITLFQVTFFVVNFHFVFYFQIKKEEEMIDVSI